MRTSNLKSIVLSGLLCCVLKPNLQALDPYQFVPTKISQTNDSIHLQWSPPPAGWEGDKVTIFKKLFSDSHWSTIIGQYSTNFPTSLIDTNITLGSLYEYKVLYTTNDLGDDFAVGLGLISGGLKLAPVHSRGKLLILTDSSQRAEISNELSTLKNSFASDGWTVVEREIERGRSWVESGYKDQVLQVKSIIKAENSIPSEPVKQLFLVGNIVVPYSGGYWAPDGHNNSSFGGDHSGAWPTDLYFVDMLTDDWGDAISDTSPDFSSNDNLPGDGKWDLTGIPQSTNNYPALKFPVGRVDLRGMTVFTNETETSLLKKYLVKDQNFRKKINNTVYARNAALQTAIPITDATNSFARTMYGLFGQPPLVVTGMEIEDYLATNAVLWANVAGAGNFHGFEMYYQPVSQDLVNPFKTVFLTSFGSWFGDWNNDSFNDIFLKAPLSGTDTLINIWYGSDGGVASGMAMQSMGFGETVGNSFTRSISGRHLYMWDGLASGNYYDVPIYVSILGDPTLRLHVLAPPSNLNVAITNTTATITWSASPDQGTLDTNEGYFVYRSSSTKGPFTLLNSTPLTGTSYATTVDASKPFYMVRLCKLESNTGTGSYYNLSEGWFNNMRLSDSVLLTNNSIFQFNITGPANLSCTIEATDNFTSWSSAGSSMLDSQGTATFHYTVGSTTKKFFRVKGTSSKSYYSENSVGYYKMDVPSITNAMVLVANQLISSPNTLNTILPAGSVPVGTQIQKLKEDGTWETSTFDDIDQAWLPDIRLYPGEGAWLRNNTTPAQAFSVWFAGEVLDRNIVNIPAAGSPAVSRLVSNTFPKTDTLSNIFPNAIPGDQVFVWNKSTQAFNASTFDDIDLAWLPNLSVNIGEAVYYQATAEENYLQNIYIWP
ncbi:MAG: hypothetical protein ACO1QB_04065 [Verrucomicrobiales bacterium]